MQLAARGAPLVGDTMYMPAAIAEADCPELNPFGRNKKEYVSDEVKALAVEEWIARHGKEPSVSIGLQACRISWDDGEHSYEARSPWWSVKKASGDALNTRRCLTQRSVVQESTSFFISIYQINLRYRFLCKQIK